VHDASVSPVAVGRILPLLPLPEPLLGLEPLPDPELGGPLSCLTTPLPDPLLPGPVPVVLSVPESPETTGELLEQ
jgi:hypothetical protein